ncbi:MAG: phenylalanine--tRNA ligase subunit beta [Clostridia bacterium]|nr:phenylalanine--tRNA ligase subunit beta [Clostridia bacterium]
MKLPLKWLKEYVDFNVTNDEFVEKMMWRGFETAEVLDEMPGIHGVVVCKISEVRPHENAEKLNVCMVDIGGAEPIQIVTNAKELQVGMQVPVALDGATLADGFEIKRTKMRGVESFGMFCGGKELGITEADYPGAGEDSVLVFREEHPCGQRIQEALDLDSVIFDIELTPNRSDCQSIIGICREAAAALGQTFHEPQIPHMQGVGNESDYASVTINNTELCPRYTARVLTDLVIEPSPEWMQKKLRSVGLRPINNIVDITNYVLIEYGHPMHAFDLACVKDGAIVVRNAEENEKVVTLDGKERICDSSMLLIADPEKGVGLAGVMGGENSEITENTKAVLFESAVFIASNIRSTSRKLRHTTDAAQRFMRGVEAHNAYLALERATQLAVELGAGKVMGDIIDVCHTDTSPRIINVDVRHVNRIIGSDFTAEYMSELLSQINIEAEPQGDTLKVHVPPHRTDIEDGIESDADIAEEVARLHGYYRLETKLMYGDTFSGHIPQNFLDDDKIHDLLAGMGCYEMYNYNFMAPSQLDALRIPEGDVKRQAVRILNPFGEDQSLMRTTLIPGILESLARNIKRKTGYGRFFEVGNVHFDNNADLPEERKMIGLGYIGDEDFFSIKGTLEQLFEAMSIENITYKTGGGEYLCPGKKAVIYANGELIGEVGALHPDVQERFEITQNALVAEIDFAKMLAQRSGKKTFKPLPKFPAADRDIAILVPENTLSADICDVIYGAKTDVHIENVHLFDVYKGKGIPEGMKSMAFGFSLRRDDRTLTDEDIASAMNRIIKTVEHKTGAKLRGV